MAQSHLGPLQDVMRVLLVGGGGLVRRRDRGRGRRRQHLAPLLALPEARRPSRLLLPPALQLLLGGQNLKGHV